MRTVARRWASPVCVPAGLQQLPEAHDGRQRGAQLVAHRGHEIVARPDEVLGGPCARLLRREQPGVPHRLRGALGAQPGQAQVPLPVGVGDPAGEAEIAEYHPVDMQRDADHAATAIRAYPRGQVPPARRGLGIRHVAERQAGIGEPHAVGIGREEARACRRGRVAQGGRHGGPAVDVERHHGEVAGQHPAGLLEDQRVEPLGVQGFAQGRTYPGQHLRLLRLLLARRRHLLRRRGAPPLGGVEAGVAQRVGDVLGEARGEPQVVRGVEARGAAADVERADGPAVDAERHGDQAAGLARARERRHVDPARERRRVGQIDELPLHLRGPQRPSRVGGARRDARRAPGGLEGHALPVVHGDAGVVAGQHPRHLGQDQGVERPGIQRRPQRRPNRLEGGGLGDLPGAQAGELLRGLRPGALRLRPGAIGLVQAGALDRLGGQLGQGGRVGALRPAEALGGGVAQHQAAQDPPVDEQRQRGAGLVAGRGVGRGEGGEAPIVGAAVRQEDSLSREHREADGGGRRERQDLRAGRQDVGAVALRAQAHQVGPVRGEQADRAAGGAKRGQSLREHHPRRVGRGAHRHERRRDRLQGGQAARVRPPPPSDGPMHATDPCAMSFPAPALPGTRERRRRAASWCPQSTSGARHAPSPARRRPAVRARFFDRC